MKYKIWDNQSKKFIENSASLHCCSNWHIDAFTGELVDFVMELSTGNYTKSENPPYYFEGTKIITSPRYVAIKSSGMFDKNGKELYDGDIVKTPNRSVSGDLKNLVILLWYTQSWDFTELDGTILSILQYPIYLHHETEVVGNIHENPELIDL